MRNFKPAAMLMLIFLLTACASSPNVNVDYNQDYDFQSISSFHLLPPNSPEGDSLPGITLAEQRVQKSIKHAMTAREVSARAIDEASIWVSFLVTTEDRQRIQTYNTSLSYGYYSRYRFGGVHWGPEVRTVDYKVGQLIIDFINPATNQVIWRGIGKKELSSNVVSQSDQVIRDQVNALFNLVPGWQFNSEKDHK